MHALSSKCTVIRSLIWGWAIRKLGNVSSIIMEQMAAAECANEGNASQKVSQRVFKVSHLHLQRVLHFRGVRTLRGVQ